MKSDTLTPIVLIALGISLGVSVTTLALSRSSRTQPQEGKAWNKLNSLADLLQKAFGVTSKARDLLKLVKLLPPVI